MIGGCCGNAPRVYLDGKWSCAECGSIIGNDADQDISDISSGHYVPKSSSTKKCECGADKTYGPGNGMHSATMPCPLYVKP